MPKGVVLASLAKSLGLRSVNACSEMPGAWSVNRIEEAPPLSRCRYPTSARL